MVSTADYGAGGFGRGPWREIIGLKKAAALNGCKGLVVERDVSTDRYLFQLVAPSDAACEAQRFGPWARVTVKAENIQACDPLGRVPGPRPSQTLRWRGKATVPRFLLAMAGQPLR